jgi:predicted dehydrogenase
VRTQLELFADAMSGRAAPPMSSVQMIATIAAFEAANKSIASGTPISVDNT